eukprot:TRINITY_DN3036_c0_g1_i1.p1 TRINITY_DN3036_c0_g1~~TRINITY_DN3036_c0_g1_i1.p1  ORF type:complete len:386 (-),score=72.61 TRINITY_DN3036_c0_g1_i1:245-1318(-)
MKLEDEQEGNVNGSNTVAMDTQNQQEYNDEYEESSSDDNMPTIIVDKPPPEMANQPYRPMPGLVPMMQMSGGVNLTWNKNGPAGPTPPNANGMFGANKMRQPGPLTASRFKRNPYEIDPTELEDKPWRKPKSDITDYFNYGFTEESWDAYCQKQQQLKGEHHQEKIRVYESSSTNKSRDDGSSQFPRELQELSDRRGDDKRDSRRESPRRGGRGSRRNDQGGRSYGMPPEGFPFPMPGKGAFPPGFPMPGGPFPGPGGRFPGAPPGGHFGPPGDFPYPGGSGSRRDRTPRSDKKEDSRRNRSKGRDSGKNDDRRSSSSRRSSSKDQDSKRESSSSSKRSRRESSSSSSHRSKRRREN